MALERFALAGLGMRPCGAGWPSQGTPLAAMLGGAAKRKVGGAPPPVGNIARRCQADANVSDAFPQPSGPTFAAKDTPSRNPPTLDGMFRGASVDGLSIATKLYQRNLRTVQGFLIRVFWKRSARGCCAECA